MPRKPTSPADEELLAAARPHDVAPTPTQLERWRGAGLVPPNETRPLGRGRGTTTAPHADALELVVWLARHAVPGRRPHDLALEAFGDGLPVPIGTVRAAWRAAVRRAVVPSEHHAPAPAEAGERGEWAWDVAERAASGSGTSATVIPRRMCRIDERIAAAGVSWNAPELAQFDRGPASPEPVTARRARADGPGHGPVRAGPRAARRGQPDRVDDGVPRGARPRSR